LTKRKSCFPNFPSTEQLPITKKDACKACFIALLNIVYIF